MSWAQWLKRVFEIDMAACPHCGGPLTIIATLEDPAVMAKILAHLGLPPAPHLVHWSALANSCRPPEASQKPIASHSLNGREGPSRRLKPLHVEPAAWRD